MQARNSRVAALMLGLLVAFGAVLGAAILALAHWLMGAPPAEAPAYTDATQQRAAPNAAPAVQAPGASQGAAAAPQPAIPPAAAAPVPALPSDPPPRAPSRSASPPAPGAPGAPLPGGAAPRPVAPRPELTEHERGIIRVFEAASPSVVFITTLELRRDFRFNVFELPRGTGSGFVWDNQGHIVTNYHVLQGAEGARVSLTDGSVYSAKLVGVAKDKDLAVLRIAAAPERLRPLPIGRSHNLVVGQAVLAIGNPFGLDHTLSTGVISGLGREIRSVTKRPIQGVIQTDAVINPGNSGGPLLDSAGRLIGVNTAIASPTGVSAGVGFAVPVDTVNRVVPQLILHGHTIRPAIGIFFGDGAWERRLGLQGVLVRDVKRGGPAARAGIQPIRQAASGRFVFDLIIGINGEAVRDPDDLFRIVDRHAVGDSVTIQLLRGSSRIELKLRLGASERVSRR